MMKSITRLFVIFSLVSCSSIAKREMGKKYIKSRYVDVHGHMRYKNIAFYYIGNKEVNCFKDQDEREVITTDPEHFEYVINHFYERMLRVNIVSVRNNGHYDIAKAHFYEKFNFDLETATCYVQVPFDLTPNEKLLISFRLAKGQER